MFKKSVRFFTLAITLVALTAAYKTASAQSSDPCDDPSAVCTTVVGGDPVPIGNIVSGYTGLLFVPTAGDPVAVSDIVDDGDSMDLDDLAVCILTYYGLA